MSAKLTITIPDWLDKIRVLPLLLYHRLRLGCPVRLIPLTKGKFAIVDPDDFLWLSKFKWHVIKKNDYLYACRRPRACEHRLSRSVFMNREVLNAPPGLLVDHRNHNTLDDRKANLRLATYVENGRNRRKLKKQNKSSKYKGVSYRRKTNCWRAAIRANGRNIQLGEFKSEIDAAKAYDTAAKLYFGEFACLNF
jgi:hypothetical protein